MHPNRKTLAAAALAVALVGASAGSMRAFGEAGDLGHGPMVQLATLEQRTWPRRRVRGDKVRGILWWIVRRVRSGAAATRARAGRLLARLPLHDSWARGPPRASHA
jgi:hypothetical protein